MNPSEYLDAVQRHCKLPSDYAIAKVFRLSRSSLSLHRTNRGTFDDSTALKVAQALEINPLLVVADMQALRAKSPDLEAFWRSIADDLRKQFAGRLKPLSH